MTNGPNIFACLVHESQECVIDLVHNLHHHDPDSLILLYNGGNDERLLKAGFPFERYGAAVHPKPQAVPWGKLHPFALDCMQFALDHFSFRTMTIVDSDQLALRSGYSARLNSFLDGKQTVGLLGNSSACQTAQTHVSPAQNAHKETDLWRPFLRRFKDGESKFVHWSFWPSTVFTADAARDLTRMFATDIALRQIMKRTQIWATEEIILPTLVALLGYEILESPFSYEYVQYRKQYTEQQVRAAQENSNAYWIHPIPRAYNDPLRNMIRSTVSNNEHSPVELEEPRVTQESRFTAGLLLTRPIITSMNEVEGWLAEEEADLLIAATSLALTQVADAEAVVEVGSYCGKATCVMAGVVKALRPGARVFAIDSHDGCVGALDQEIKRMPPTLEKLKCNLQSTGVSEFVNVVVGASYRVEWQTPTSLVLIDGLHDYANVARDFFHFEPHLVAGGYAAFHDYADYYPGVMTFVNELLRSGWYEKVHCAGSMIVLRKVTEAELPVPARAEPAMEDVETLVSEEQTPLVIAKAHAEVMNGPLVSCIMPTADRRKLVPLAIQYFLRQDYANRELIVLDDGADSVADLMPADDRIRYVRMSERQTMGAKHNMACAMARGEIIAHWDDDDWMANYRLSYQVRELMAQPPMTLCGLSRLIYYDPAADRSWEYIYQQNGKPWVCGNSFCYRKVFWDANRFPSRNEGADTAWVWGLKGQKVVALTDHRFYVAIMHATNTSPKRPHSPPWHSYPTEEVQRIMQDDWSAYRELAPRMRAGQ